MSSCRWSGTRRRTHAARTSCLRRCPARPGLLLGRVDRGALPDGGRRQDLGRHLTRPSLQAKPHRHPGVRHRGPGRDGRLYAGFIGEGLWRSDDKGAHWAKVFPLDGRPFNASSVAVGGPGPDDLYVSCEPLGLSPCLSALLHSPDGGRTWADLYDPGLGALRMKTIAVDHRTGTVEVGTCGQRHLSGHPGLDDCPIPGPHRFPDAGKSETPAAPAPPAPPVLTRGATGKTGASVSRVWTSSVKRCSCSHGLQGCVAVRPLGRRFVVAPGHDTSDGQIRKPLLALQPDSSG